MWPRVRRPGRRADRAGCPRRCRCPRAGRKWGSASGRRPRPPGRARPRWGSQARAPSPRWRTAGRGPRCSRR
ncbi:MAG: RNA-binding protein, partial [Actinobacteria bacterium]|nr:RNA-binding protein [Actinomycetota bacterium]